MLKRINISGGIQNGSIFLRTPEDGFIGQSTPTPTTILTLTNISDRTNYWFGHVKSSGSTNPQSYTNWSLYEIFHNTSTGSSAGYYYYSSTSGSNRFTKISKTFQEAAVNDYIKESSTGKYYKITAITTRDGTVTVQGQPAPATNSFNLAIVNIEGLTPQKASSVTNEDSLFDGGIIVTHKIGIRNIILTVKMQGDDIKAVRNNVYKVFPLGRAITLEFKDDDNNETLLGRITGMVDGCDADIFTNQCAAQISILCEDPFFTTGGESTASFSNGNFSYAYNGNAEYGTVFTFTNIGSACNGVWINDDINDREMYIDFASLRAVYGTIGTSDRVVIDTRIATRSVKLIQSSVEKNGSAAVHSYNQAKSDKMAQPFKWILFSPNNPTSSWTASTNGGSLPSITVLKLDAYGGI